MVDLSCLVGQRILVVGDVMLDEYIWGEVHRISPEAPVPVVAVQRTTYAPGGAGNVAANIAGLGGQAYLAAVIGQDSQGDLLRGVLREREVDLQGVLVSPDRPTTTKTRIIAHNQQVVRVDRETVRSLSRSEENTLLEWIQSHMQLVDACVLSDYAKGVLTPRICEAVIEMARVRRMPVVVDPKAVYFDKYRGAAIITPNLKEAISAARALDQTLVAEEEEVESNLFVERVGEILLRRYGNSFLITRGAYGMTLIQADPSITHIPAQARQVYDVTGAGDAAVAALVLGLAAELSLESAARLANAAAGVVVGKMGTATVTASELKMTIEEGQ